MLFKTDAEKAFGVETYLSQEMDAAIKLWQQLESGKPTWVKEDTRTIRFSNTVARELSKLVTQNIDIKVQAKYGTGETAAKIQKAIDDYFLKNAQQIMQDVIMLGGSMAKWNGKGMDYIPPDRFLVTEFDSNGDINGAIFFSYYQKEKKFYTRAEWHRWETVFRFFAPGTEGGPVKQYRVSNKAFVSDQQDQIGRETSLKNTKWADIVPEFTAENLEKPLFVYIKNPYSNTIDPDSPLGVSCFSECIEELRWLDIAMSTMGIETEDSEPKMIVGQSVIQYAETHGINLPRLVLKDIGADDLKSGTPFEQWQPTLQVASRVEGINFYLSIISYKTGFDPGFFVFDGQNIQMATATQVESTERRTVNTVLSYRSLLDRPNSNGDGRIGVIHDIVYIIDAMAVINGEYPPTEYGNYELFCDFADITENKEEDKMFECQLANNGYMSKARFLVRHLGLTEEEAIAMVQEAVEESMERQKSEGQNGLFGEE